MFIEIMLIGVVFVIVLMAIIKKKESAARQKKEATHQLAEEEAKKKKEAARKARLEELQAILNEPDFIDGRLFLIDTENAIAFGRTGKAALLNQDSPEYKIVDVKDITSLKFTPDKTWSRCNLTVQLNDFNNPLFEINLGYYEDNLDKQNAKEIYNEIKAVFDLLKKPPKTDHKK